METNKEFKENLKNNEKRKKFFIDKYKTDLKHLDINCDDTTIEKLLLEAIETFEEEPILFYSYGLNYLEDKLKTEDDKYTPNSIFSKNEMIILKNYLEKDINGNYLTNEEIAKKLDINILEIAQVIYKLTDKVNYHKIKKVLGDFNQKLIKRKIGIKKQKAQNNTKKIVDITDNDIEIIGLFTGQINDICLDIEEIAKLKNSTTHNIKEQIINIYELLENKNNYDKLLLKYPTITQMLKIKGTGLGLKLSFSTTVKKNNPPTKIKKDNSSNKINLPIDDISNSVQTLKYFYQPKSDGTYASPQEIANLLNYTNVNSIYLTKNKILKRIETDNEYKMQILKEYPSLENDMELRKKTHIQQKRKMPNEKIIKEAQLLQYFYQQKLDGTYVSTQEIVDLLDYKNIHSIQTARRRILQKLSTDSEYKKLILKEYPSLDEDIELKKNIHDAQIRKSSNEKIIKDAQILKYFYQQNSDGTYSSPQEIANLLNYTNVDSIYLPKNKILKRIETDHEYKMQILKEYPELDRDMEIRNNTNIGKQEKIIKKKILQKIETDSEYKKLILKEYPTLDDDTWKRDNTNIPKKITIPYEKVKKYAQILKYYYQPKSDGTYASLQEVANLLNIENVNSLYKTKAKILQKIETDSEYKKLILKEYPTLEDDIEERSNTTLTQQEKIKKDAQILKYFYQKRLNGTYASPKEIVSSLDYKNIRSIQATKNDILKKLNSDSEYKSKILEEYPTLEDDIEEKGSNQTPKIRKITDKQIIKDTQFLKYFYQQRQDGTYTPTQEIVKILNYSHTNAIYKTKKKILQKLETDREYKELILKKYPNLEADMELKKNIQKAQKGTISNEKVKKDAQFLKYFYQPKSDGSYLSPQEITDLLDYKNTDSMNTVRRIILKNLNTNSEYKSKILEEYPSLDDDIELKSQKVQKRATSNKKVKKDTQILKYFYQQTSDGTYLSAQEITTLLNYKNISSVYVTKNDILKKLSLDSQYKSKILEEYPNLEEDIELKKKFQEAQKRTISNEKVKKDAQFLKYFYQKRQDGTYTPLKEMATLLNYTNINSLYKTKGDILKKLNDNHEYKSKILEEYPTLEDDIEERGNTNITNQNKTPNEKIKKDVQLLKYIYKQRQDGSYLSILEIKDILNFQNANSIYKAKSKILKKLKTDSEYKELILQEYPNLDEDIELKKNIQEVQKRTIPNEKVKNDAQILKYLYQPNPDGTYLSLQEISKLLNYDGSTHNIYTIKNRILQNLELNDKYKEQILKEYPELDSDIETKNNTHITQQRKIIKDAQILKYFYQKRLDGTYASTQEISELANISMHNITSTKNKILKKLNTDNQYKAQILNEYPNLEDDIEIKNNTCVQKDRIISHKKINRDIELLKSFYQPKSDGSYLSTLEIAKNLNFKNIRSVYTIKSKILTKINTDSEYKELILKEYPNFENDLEQKEKNNIINQEKLEKDTQILKYFYQKRPDGTYASTKEIAKILNYSISSIHTIKSNLLKMIATNPNYKEQILKEYPELDKDMGIRNITSPVAQKREISNEKITKDAQILKCFYQQKQDGTYASTQEIAKYLNYNHINNVYTKKKKILQKLDTDNEYKSKILEEYPNLEDDIETKNNKNLLTEFTEKEKELATLLYTDDTKIIEPKESYCKKLNINPATFEILRTGVMTKLVKNEKLRKKYPHYEVEDKIIEDYHNNRSIILSEEELSNIKNNSRRYDIPNNNKYIANDNNDNLMRGIKSLEESNYSDYISQCTYEQKAMIALKFAFFNNTSYSTKYVCNKFNVNKDELSILMNECLETCKAKQKMKVK